MPYEPNNVYGSEQGRYYIKLYLNRNRLDRKAIHKRLDRIIDELMDQFTINKMVERLWERNKK